MRYARIGDDLGLTEKEVTDNLNFAGAKHLDHVNVAMNPVDRGELVRPRSAGPVAGGTFARVGLVYTYLKSFYMDESRRGLEQPRPAERGDAERALQLQGASIR